MKLMLRLTYDEFPQRGASAYFVPGRSADEWLEELTAWQTPLAAARLFLVPAANHARTPDGVFVLGAAPPADRRSPHALPYGAIARRLYLPLDAKIDPPVSDAELDKLLESDDALYLWRPQAGLIELAGSRALAVSDLLTAPEHNPSAWNRGVAGIALNARLFSIEPETTPTAESVLEDARGDIATQPLDLNQLPPAPNEPAPGIQGAAGRAIERALAQAMLRVLRHIPHTGAVYNWMNTIEDWAAAKLNKLAQSLEASRHRELLRLLDLLRSDPDEGLRFALPMGSDEHRGLAAPSGRLGRRNVDFSLDRLRGGGTADLWDVPAMYRAQLIARYCELASREIALGRHRRAAYIFATLLRDVRSAANALADGGHWREAAVLFEERLKQPHEAARCLRQGGLWAEAIALYEKLGEHETAGDLYRQLDQPDEAERAWRRAVVACDARLDTLGAARLLEHKLGQIDEAWQRLLTAWPRSRQATPCVNEAFKLLARHGWHERASALVERLTAEPAAPQPEAAVVEMVAAQALEYPEPAVREHAADRARVAAAERLDHCDLKADDARRIALAVGRLAPQDRLLGRDVQRWLQQRLQPPRGGALVGQAKAKLSLEHEFRLPSLDWKGAVSTDEALYAAGYRDREVALVRVSWRTALNLRSRGAAAQNAGLFEEPAGPPWRVEPQFVGGPILLAADPFDEAPTLVHVLGHEALAPRSFVPSERFPSAMTAGGHRGLSAKSMAAAYSGRVTVDIADLSSELTLVVNAYLSSNAQLLGLVSLDLKPPFPDSFFQHPTPLLAREETLCAAMGQELHFFQRRRKGDVLSLPSAVTQLVGSAPHTRARIAVAMEQGCVVLWGAHADAPQTPFASEMIKPRIALTRRGWFVAASKDEIEVYGTIDNRFQRHARAPGNGSAPLAALALYSVNHFALLYTDGRVAIYRVP